jgi:hypothetical protein
MSQETIYFCDYSGVAPRHTAVIAIRDKDNSSEKLPATSIDTCVEHFCQMSLDLLRADPRVRLDIRVLDPNVTLEMPTKAKFEKAHGPCLTCDKTFASRGSLRAHIRLVHPEGEAQ